MRILNKKFYIAIFAGIFAITTIGGITFAKPDFFNLSNHSDNKKAIFERNGNIYLYNESDNSIENIAGNLGGRRLPRLSPNNNLLAFSYEVNSNNPDVKVGIYDINGKTSKKDIVICSRYTNAVNDIDWLGTDKIGVEGHVSPRASEYLIYNISDSSLIKTYTGTLFTALPNNAGILYKGLNSYSNQKEYADSLFIEDTEIYTSDSANYVIKYPQLSSDFKRIAFVETNFYDDSQKRLVTGDVDIISRKLTNVNINEITPEIHGSLLFDQNGNACFTDNDCTFKLQKGVKQFSKITTEIDANDKTRFDNKYERFKNNVLKEFTKGNEVVNPYVNDISWFN